MRCLPESYLDVSNRCVTNTDGELIGLGFERPCGNAIRLALTLPDAEALARSILETARLYRVRTSSAKLGAGGTATETHQEAA